MNDTPPQKPWWSPEVLAEREREVRTGSDPANEDLRNDFASYRALVSGADTSQASLHLHNECEPWRVDTVCRDYQAVVRAALGRPPRTIADLGCGAGFTTDGLKRTWPAAVVHGFDVSHDAVTVARSRWPACQFTQVALSPDVTVPCSPYDFILCQEFYPFTRTGEIADHRSWLSCLSRSLVPGGVAVVMISAATPESVNDTFGELRSEFALQRVRVAAPRISRSLPFAASCSAAAVLRIVKPLWVRNLYVLRSPAN
jgi:2-polyprenyl-3-methyl-5-hydroxy-6-metoxy-1,4-benzoquinol methylase